MPYEHDEADEDPGPDESETKGLPKRERDYVIPAADAQHVSVRIQCRLQPAYARLISDVHQSKKYPFRVQGDLVRWCVVTGVKRLAAGAGINTVVAHADAILEALRDEEYQLQFTENMAVMKRVIDRYIERQAMSKARELVTRMRLEIEAMPHGYWRVQYLGELERRYGTLMDGDRTAAAAGTGAFVIDHDEGDR